MIPGRCAEPLLGSLPSRPRWWRAALLGLALVIAVAVPAQTAPAQAVDEAREQREATRAEQARVAAELDALNADASTVEAALAGLDQALAFQRAEVEAATQALAGAQATAAIAQAEVEATGAGIAAIEARVTDAVVDRYTGGLADDTEQFLGASDVTEISQRDQLLDVVRGRYDDDLEQLRSLKERQRRATETAAAAVAQTAAVTIELEAAKAELADRRATQAELQAALQAKIGDVQAQVDRLDAAEAELTAVINEHLAEQAAAAGRSSAAPVLSAASTSGFMMPAPSPITSSFGYRIHPITGTSRLHSGTDFGASYGTPIVASKSGEVIFSGWNGGYGNCVIIAHEGGFSTLYAHMSEIAVGVGGGVGQGETVGWVGSTGASTGPHLHFEIWVGGEPTDPMNFL